MSRLLRVELRRVGARRLVRLLVLLLLAVLGTTLIVSAVQSDRDLAGARATAERQAVQYGPVLEEVAACESAAAASGARPEEIRCRPVAADFYRDPRLRFAKEATNYANLGVGLGMAFTVVLAVAAIGAEWAAGTFAALLLWEPRRRRVLAAKLTAVAITGAVLTAVVTAALVGGVWLIAATRGTLEGRAGPAASEALMHGVRGVAGAGLLALIFGSLAVVLRSTAGALGLVAIYAIAVENVLRAFRPQWARWEPGPNVIALVGGRLELQGVARNVTSGFGEPPVFVLSAGRAAVYLAVLAIAAVAAAAVFLQRRDVT